MNHHCLDKAAQFPVDQGPLHNLGAALDMGGLTLGRWVAQGGFAGEGVVPRHLQMERPGTHQSKRTPGFLFEIFLSQYHAAMTEFHFAMKEVCGKIELRNLEL